VACSEKAMASVWRCRMTEHVLTAPPTAVDEATRGAALHHVYSYLLRLAAQKRAADQDAADNQTRSAESGSPALDGAENRKCMTG
jgi:hypothetical protein